MPQPTNTRSSVEKRYADAAKAPEAALCCPVEYDRKYLEVIPDEVIEKDYGCGDPSKWVQPGETVLDLGSGTGKICFIASQVVGAEGKVIGVDMTDDMLEVANRNAPIIAERIGYGNVEFRKGRIQDLALDLDLLGEELEAHPVASASDFLKLDEIAEELRVKQPLVQTESVDVVVSNCVLNLVEPEQKPKLFREIFRVLKNGGRAVISDIVSDELVPAAMREDAHLWSGCISGALTEEGFLQAFEDAGFYGIELVKFETQSWQTVEGIEFRSVTVQAFKGEQRPCLEHNQAVIYQGPFKSVLDDDGHRFDRGVRTAVCDKTFNLLQSGPYAGYFAAIEPLEPVEADSVQAFDCVKGARRHPKETKGQDYDATTDAAHCVEGGECC
ncbi:MULTISPECIES: methyltransferase domain-containing protein [unclassified Lentimonas]|uniref:methyltransferase domain-containing protein n=1 Tax=unclassified Lentimonas TaxID=2630993 RepID=UPI0013288F16|nr:MULTISPECIES: methyltransferase domain-containing protein [unclassified Lentimonas]CAA6690555.1 Methyltransferase [Lentimonas sp. CC10]CAA6695363.1 Methyltransferase [Lentimonas sp. CC19]CAA7068812.1 Methyltransferase [Lentimonas sp. CC11]